MKQVQKQARAARRGGDTPRQGYRDPAIRAARKAAARATRHPRDERSHDGHHH